ncbi:Rpe [Symbiodinium necroappetens]|uniref:Rpe protein n=1 Tax=Symbiodinium necroappetens TaxID=1628268 RepID=A0A812XE54_9DINO|nr:Rpe [Symbiodinium necroappetens]
MIDGNSHSSTLTTARWSTWEIRRRSCWQTTIPVRIVSGKRLRVRTLRAQIQISPKQGGHREALLECGYWMKREALQSEQRLLELTTEIATRPVAGAEQSSQFAQWMAWHLQVYFLHLLGFTMQGPILPALRAHFHLRASQTGLITSAFPTGMLVALFFYPRLSDVWGRRSSKCLLK